MMTFEEYCATTGHYAENGDRALWEAATKAERETWTWVYVGKTEYLKFREQNLTRGEINE